MKDVVASILARLKNKEESSNLSYQMCFKGQSRRLVWEEASNA